MSANSFGARSTFKVGHKEYELYRLDALDKQGISTRRLPFSLRILLENLLRTEDGRNVTKDEIRALAAWNKNSKPEKEIAFTPSRVLLQDFPRPARRSRPRRHARCHEATGRRRQVDQSATACGISHRPLGAGGWVWVGR